MIRLYALRFYGLLVEHRYDEAWQMVFRYEEPWLKAALELDWLFSIKAAIDAHGLFPDDYATPFQPSDQGKREKALQCLERVFGPIRKVEL